MLLENSNHEKSHRIFYFIINGLLRQITSQRRFREKKKCAWGAELSNTSVKIYKEESVHELHEHVAVVTKKLSNLLFIQRRSLPEILSRSLCNYYVTFNSILIQPIHSSQFVLTMKSKAFVLIHSLLCILQNKNYVKRYFMHGELFLPKMWLILHDFIWNYGCLVWYTSVHDFCLMLLDTR